MTRSLAAGVSTAVASGQVRPVAFVELDTEDGYLRYSSADRSLTFSSMTFTGLGDLGTISPLREPTDLSAEGITITLTGIPDTHIDLALDTAIQGRRARIWLGFLDANYAIIVDPVLLFVGRMDNQSITLGDVATVMTNIESRMADWDRPRVRRYTDADQQARFPSDRGLEYVSDTAEKVIDWGQFR